MKLAALSWAILALTSLEGNAGWSYYTQPAAEPNRPRAEALWIEGQGSYATVEELLEGLQYSSNNPLLVSLSVCFETMGSREQAQVSAACLADLLDEIPTIYSMVRRADSSPTRMIEGRILAATLRTRFFVDLFSELERAGLRVTGISSHRVEVRPSRNRFRGCIEFLVVAQGSAEDSTDAEQGAADRP